MRSAAILLALLAGVVGAWLLLGRGPVQPMRDTNSVSAAMASPHPVQTPRSARASTASARAESSWFAEGIVLSQSGGALSEARVCALVASGVAVKPTCVGTDASGHFTLAGTGSLPVEWLASAPGHESRRESIGGRPVDAAWTLTLKPAPVEGVSGWVIDATGGPVIGAQVMAWDASANPALAATAATDGRGSFSLALPGGSWLLRAVSEGYSVGSRWVRAPARDTLFSIVPASVVAGHVIEQGTGRPVSAVTVHALGAWDATPESAVSDDTGAFRFDALGTGQYQFLVRDEHFRSETRDVVLAVGQSVDSLEIEVSLSAGLVGRVSTHRGACVSGRVELLGPTSSVSSIEAEGVARFNALAPGSYQVSVYCDGSLPTFDLVEIGSEWVERHWQVDSGLYVRGLARRSSGRVLAGAHIVVDELAPTSEGNDATQRLQSNCSTSADGRFECGGLVAGQYTCRLATDLLPSAATVQVSLVDGEDASVVLVAPASGTLVATLPGAEEQAAAAHVFAVRKGEGEVLQASGSASRFVFDDLPLGAYELFLGPPDLGGTAAGRATIARDEERVHVELRGSRTHTLRGVVVDRNGTPVPDAWVTAESEWEPDASRARPRVLTDEAGQFVLSGIWPGRQRVSASSPLGEASVGGVPAGAAGVTLRLEAQASLLGTVRTPSGLPVAQFSLEYLRDSSSGGAIRGHDGYFELSMLWPGSYTVSVASSEGSASVEGLVLEPGERREVVLTVGAN